MGKKKRKIIEKKWYCPKCATLWYITNLTEIILCQICGYATALIAKEAKEKKTNDMDKEKLKSYLESCVKTTKAETDNPFCLAAVISVKQAEFIISLLSADCQGKQTAKEKKKE
jgi:Zn ribbon nucleic-acid-binding protein